MSHLQGPQQHVAEVGQCTHAIPDSLVLKLPKPQVCPNCIIREYVRTIKDVQRQLADRGGTFKSREIGKGHKKLRKAWRDAKIALTNTILDFEEMVTKKEVPPEDLGGIQNALDTWGNEKVVLGRMPGVVYVEGAAEEEPTEEDHEVARLMMELLKAVLKRELSKEDLVAVSKADVAVDAQQASQTRQQSFQQQASLPKSVVPPPNRAPQSEGRPKPILKRHASTSPTASSPQKRVRITDLAVVSSETLSNSNPSPFTRLSKKTTVLPHGDHTSAEHHRRRPEFNRSTPTYTPGVWASKAFSEKANTSFFKTPVNIMERSVREEIEEEEMEKDLAKRLKMVVGGWVVLWWIRNVAPHWDVEKLREASMRV
ncbi:uncharacterized protein K460DRAFT_351304 [Cucurbitaria berberidis CBS 394.84]|uniref:Uncharacterized protein n=1 Tax=Cucurbitaria berberidis CBS 394.84 TaxID=1168544 RepID=A0A9P4LDU6_9PLEO|nr:uncharacterized protein K460DRAFT_351304 [Cucurbitaria berberidis CBS 394.84]KAF1851375.1 hypothetical protein K460DRAFT_351304 [Cucurbitaria berberidis CBS 394.84]